MPNRNKRYRKGVEAEYRLKRYLEEAGWTVVRSAGSHGFWDLVAFKFKRNGHLDILLLQVKSSEPPSKSIHAIINTGKFRALEAVVYVRGRAILLSQTRSLSLDDPFRAFRPSRKTFQVFSSAEQVEQPTDDLHDDRNE